MTFDFAAFIVCAKTLGADHVHFRYEGEIQTKKFPAEVAWNRFENIHKPLCDLAGMTYTVGPGGDGIAPAYHYGTVEALCRKLGHIWKFPMLDGPRGYVTVTLRDSFRNEVRNSGPEWQDFINASKKRVVVLPDCEHDPIPIADRMRLYANADMNFGTSNGPLALQHFSDAPYRTFNVSGTKELQEHMNRTGFPVGSQFSFRNPKQLLIWDKGSILDHIED
jgi:hypothetical protein